MDMPGLLGTPRTWPKQIMSDQLGSWVVRRKKRTDAAYSTIVTITDTTKRSYDDPDPVPVEGNDYKLVQITATNHVVIPYNDASLSVPGQFIWLQDLLSSGGNGVNGTSVYGIAAVSNRVIIAGELVSNVVIAGTNLVAAAGTDGFIASLNNSTGGTALYTPRRMGGQNNDGCRTTASDSSGNVYVAGYFGNNQDLTGIDFGGTTRTAVSDVSHNSIEIFVAKYNSSGALQWVTRAGGLFGDASHRMAVDASGNVYITGYIGASDADFGSTTISPLGTTGLFVAKLNSSGVFQWAKGPFGGNAISYGIAIDPTNGDVVITGEYYDSINFGSKGKPGSHSFPGAFVTRFDNSGNHIWDKTWYVDGYLNRGRSVAISPTTRNIVVVGQLGGGPDLGGGPLGGGMFLLGLDMDGNYLWANGYGSTSVDADSFLDVKTDSAGNLAVSGVAYAGAVNFGAGWLIGNGNVNALIAAFTISGNSPPVYRWGKRYGTGNSGSSLSRAVAMDGAGYLYAGGAFYGGGIDFGNGTVTAPGIQAHGFLVKYVF